MADAKKHSAADGDEALRRPDGETAHLGGARGGARRDRLHPGQAGHLRGLGGLGRAARARRRLPARAPQAGRHATATRARCTGTTARAASTRAGTSTSSRADGIRTFRRFLDEATDLVLSIGGSLSGEHGDGQSRAELLPKMFGERPRRRLPRVQVDLGPGLEDEPGQGRRPVPRRREPPARRRRTSRRDRRRTSRYPQDDGDFAHATVRCVGVGKCRTHRAGATSCARASWHARGDALDARPRAACCSRC